MKRIAAVGVVASTAIVVALHVHVPRASDGGGGSDRLYESDLIGQ